MFRIRLFNRDRRERENAFVKEWHGRDVLDMGGYVSRQFKQFQSSLKQYLSDVAKDTGAKLTNCYMGHYVLYGAIEKSNRRIQFIYKPTDDMKRSVPDLMSMKPFRVRADGDNDWTYVPVNSCRETIAALLK